MGAVHCPLCHKLDHDTVVRIDSRDLAKLYAWKLKVDVTREFSDVSEIELLHCKTCDLRFFFPIVAASGAFYSQLQNFPWYYEQKKDEYEFARGCVEPGDRVLDVGCGKGAFAAYVDSGSFTGLELNETAHAAARANNLNVKVETVQSHAEKHADEYDVVTAFQVLEHIADPRSFFDACVRCVKPSGKLIISVPAYDSFVPRMVNYALNLPPHHVTWWSDRALENMGRQFGLSTIRLRHESLLPQHRRLYSALIAEERLRQPGEGELKVLDLSLKFRILSRVAWTLSGILDRPKAAECEPPRGHAVTVVFQKLAPADSRKP